MILEHARQQGSDNVLHYEQPARKGMPYVDVRHVLWQKSDKQYNRTKANRLAKTSRSDKQINKTGN